MFEIVTCAARSLVWDGALIGLTNVAIPSPVVLSGNASAEAEATVDVQSGAVELVTMTGKAQGTELLLQPSACTATCSTQQRLSYCPLCAAGDSTAPISLHACVCSRENIAICR